MLADLRRGGVNEEQDLFAPSASPDSSCLAPYTQLGRLLAWWHRGSGRAPSSPLLPSQLPRAAAALSPPIHESERGTPPVPEHRGRRTSSTGTGQSIPSFLPTRIVPKQPRPRSRLPAPLPPAVAPLQPADTGDPKTHQSRSPEKRRWREQEVGLQ